MFASQAAEKKDLTNKIADEMDGSRKRSTNSHEITRSKGRVSFRVI